MGVVNLPSGRPTMKLTGGAAARLAKLTPAGHEARIDLTITDEYPLAQAFVIISAVPAGRRADNSHRDLTRSGSAVLKSEHFVQELAAVAISRARRS